MKLGRAQLIAHLITQRAKVYALKDALGYEGEVTPNDNQRLRAVAFVERMLREASRKHHGNPQ